MLCESEMRIYQDLFLDSAALNLHDYYSGLERIFSRIATVVDANLPAGVNWHQQLLMQMQHDIPDIRPPVISAHVAGTLDEFRRFRHVVRNIYAFQFDLAQVARLVALMINSFPQIRSEIQEFAQFLKQVGDG